MAEREIMGRFWEIPAYNWEIMGMNRENSALDWEINESV